MSLNQVVAYNMERWRKAADMTQAELGDRLGWSFRAVSAAERTWDRTDGKGRVFDAPLIAALARILGVPVLAMLLPPSETSERYLFHAPEHDSDGLAMEDLFASLLPGVADEGPAVQACRQALADAAERYLDPARSGDLITYLRQMADPQAREAEAERLETLREAEQAYRQRLRTQLQDTLDELTAFLMTRIMDLEAGPGGGQR